MGRRAKHQTARAVVLAVLALGLLIWAKLRLVTTIPRSAFADPKQGQKGPAQSVRQAPPERPAR